MKLLLKTFSYLFLIIFSIYLCVCGYLYFNQDEILFYPQKTSPKDVTGILINYPNFDTLSFTMKDGNRTYGYISKDTIIKKLPLILYFGGNAEEVSHLADYKNYFPNTVMALINYRSFGLSNGKISEQTMFSDALEIYDKLIAKPEIDATKVFVIGRSIGTGVASYLSSQRKTKATILITPYESMIDVAQEKYPFIPISLLIKHHFESDKYATTITTPMLALISKNDQVIPPHHAHNLLNTWNGKTTFLEVDEDHNSIMKNEDVWKKIEKFVQENNSIE
jgi:hypothetical protein